MKYMLFCVGLLLSGCTIERNIVTPSTMETSSEAPGYSVSADDVFLFNLHKFSPASKSMPDDLLIDTGRATCDALKRGVTLDDVLGMIDVASVDMESRDMMEWITVNAVVHYCPEFEYIFKNTN